MKYFLMSSLVLFFSGFAVAIEEPKYTVLEKFGDFELRSYSPKIIAETQVFGSMGEASSKGFRLIADYIFGHNTSQRGGGTEKMSMTAPVTIEPQISEPQVNEPGSEKIEMTTPVSMEQVKGQPAGQLEELHEDQSRGQWRVYFVMPSEYSLETLPKPNNPAVTLREIPAIKYAVIRFSGFAGETKVANKTVELMAWLKNKEIESTGQVELARYNPPWTLPFLRRNEVMVAY
ncbi:MAG: hypothetical protein ACJAUP_000509 [Cellvibrionaceae bacterium]|jgi:hypothetical protein